MATQAELDAHVAASDPHPGYALDSDLNLYVPKSLIDAKGDLLVGTANDSLGRLAVGTDGSVLTADSAQTTGVKWASVGGVDKFSDNFAVDNLATNYDVAFVGAVAWTVSGGAAHPGNNWGGYNVKTSVLPLFSGGYSQVKITPSLITSGWLVRLVMAVGTDSWIAGQLFHQTTAPTDQIQIVARRRGVETIPVQAQVGAIVAGNSYWIRFGFVGTTIVLGYYTADPQDGEVQATNNGIITTSFSSADDIASFLLPRARVGIQGYDFTGGLAVDDLRIFAG